MQQLRQIHVTTDKQTSTKQTTKACFAVLLKLHRKKMGSNEESKPSENLYYCLRPLSPRSNKSRRSLLILRGEHSQNTNSQGQLFPESIKRRIKSLVPCLHEGNIYFCVRVPFLIFTLGKLAQQTKLLYYGIHWLKIG